MIEAKNNGISVRSQIPVPVKYNGKRIGTSRADLICFDKILVELKLGSHLSMDNFHQTHEYFKLFDLKLGLLVLFSPKKVTVRRVFNRY